jgi:hypothetical protein
MDQLTFVHYEQAGLEWNTDVMLLCIPIIRLWKIILKDDSQNVNDFVWIYVHAMGNSLLVK